MCELLLNGMSSNKSGGIGVATMSIHHYRQSVASQGDERASTVWQRRSLKERPLPRSSTSIDNVVFGPSRSYSLLLCFFLSLVLLVLFCFVGFVAVFYFSCFRPC